MAAYETRFCTHCAQALAWVTEAEDGGPTTRLRCTACGWTHWNNPTPVLAAIVQCTDRDGQVLLARNAAWPQRMFALITGFMEAGESPQEGVAREVREETSLVADAVHAFDILRNNLRRRHGKAAGMQARADLDALFIWSALHGMASISQSQAMDNLRLAPGVAAAFRGYLMQKVGIALEVPVHPRPADCRPARGSAGTGISRASTRKP